LALPLVFIFQQTSELNAIDYTALIVAITSVVGEGVADN
jgi:hypothetical protein